MRLLILLGRPIENIQTEKGGLKVKEHWKNTFTPNDALHQHAIAVSYSDTTEATIGGGDRFRDNIIIDSHWLKSSIKDYGIANASCTAERPLFVDIQQCALYVPGGRVPIAGFEKERDMDKIADGCTNQRLVLRARDRQ